MKTLFFLLCLPLLALAEEEESALPNGLPASAAAILYAREVVKLPYPDDQGRPIILAPETKFKIEALNKNGGIWQPGQELHPPEAMNAKGEWMLKVRATPLGRDERPLPAPIRPYVASLGDFTSVAPKQEIAITQTPRTRRSLAPVSSEAHSAGSEGEILAALQAFHDRGCSSAEEGANLRERFLAAWENFVNANNEFSRVAKERARDVDLVLRTTLHESSPPGWFDRGEQQKYQTHSKMHQCERAIISMTMVSRIRLCKPNDRTKYYMCKKENDSVGVITEPNQYNIWFDRYLNRQTLVSCYLRSDLGPGASYFHRDGRGYSSGERALYESYRLTYRNMIPVVMDLFCYSDRCASGRRPEDILKNRHLYEMIRAEEVELRTNLQVEKPGEGAEGRLPLSSPIAQSLVLPKTVTYFHPRDMGGCSTRDWPQNKYLRVAYVHCADANEKRFLVKDRVVLVDDNGQTVERPDPRKRYRFRLLLNSDQTVPGENICRGATVDGLFANEPNEVTGCIPKGYFPECTDRATIPGSGGRPVFPGRDLEERLAAYRNTSSGLKISINLTRPAQVESIQRVAPQWITSAMEARSRALNAGHQKYHVGLRCVYPAWGFQGTREENFSHPLVGGKCDQTILPSTDWGEKDPGFSRPVL